MSTKQIPRIELPDSRFDLPPRKPGHWILAGTPGDEPYPCTCRYDPCRYERCPDRTRMDREQVADRLPPGCCGRPDAVAARPGKRREASERAGGHSGVAAQGSGAQRGSEGAAIDAGVQMADSDLWGAPLEPLPPWDDVDEDAQSHTDANGQSGGHSGTPAGATALSVDLSGLADAKARARQAQCQCRTPWDADPPALLVAGDAKEGTMITMHVRLSDKPGADVRSEADLALTARDMRRAKPWKNGRHALLPAVRGKTRECWSAALTSGAMAVVDLPPAPLGGGVHCGGCCRNFQNAGAWELHRPKSKPECVDPALVMLVPRGTMARSAIGDDDKIDTESMQADTVPLLKQSINGVWVIDPLAAWGRQGPRLTAAVAQTIWTQAQRTLAASRWKFGRGHNRL